MELINDNIYLVKNLKIFSSNTYILYREVDNDCIIIDPGLDTEAIDRGLQKHNLKPIAIISTHGHFDHIGSASFFKNKFKIPFYLHTADYKLSQSVNFFLKVARLNHKIETPMPDHLFEGEQEELSIKGFNFSIFNFPGHSPGSCIVKEGKFLFSGDIVYKDGLGIGSMPKEDLVSLKKSLIKIFKTFSDDDLILPGHGNSEYIAFIRENNSELKFFISENK